MAACQGREAEILRERGFADATLSTEEDVLSAWDEVEGGVQMFVQTAIDGAGIVLIALGARGTFTTSPW